MMTRMPLVGVAGQVGRFRPEQIAQQKTWTKIPEDQRVFADMHVVHVQAENQSTTTYVNPCDPGDGCYIEAPYTWPDDKYQSTKGRPGFF
jgi:hypothetical protein